MPSSTINFRMTGFGRILQEIGQAPKKLNEVTRAGQAAARAAANAGAAWAQRVSGRGAGAARVAYPSSWASGLGGGAPAGVGVAGAPAGRAVNERASRGIAGRWAKVAGAFGGMSGGPIGQIAEAANAPTRALAALGVAGVVAGVGLKLLGAKLEESARQIENDLRTRSSTRGSLAAATASANQSALSSVLGRREELIGGDRGNAATRGFFAKTDAIQKQIEAAELDRALKYGEGEMRDQLARTRAPEAAALTELSKKADEEVEIQRQILEQTSNSYKVWLAFTNAWSGRLYNANLTDAEASRNATAAGAP